MYTLYYSPGACSLAVHALLVETGVPYTLKNVSISSGANRQQQFLQINPRGQVPVLEANGKVLKEGGAILLSLCEKHPNAWMPQAGAPGREEALEWLLYGNSTLHPAAGRVFFVNRAITDSQARAIANEAAVKAFQKAWDDVEQHLAVSGRAFLAGGSMTLADVLMTVIAGWIGRMSPALTLGSNTLRLVETVRQHPSFQKAAAAETQADSQAA